MDMKTYRFGVLGAGSMGKTIAAGAVRAGLFRPDEVLLFNRSEEKRAANRAEGYAVTGDFTEVYTACAHARRGRDAAGQERRRERKAARRRAQPVRRDGRDDGI